MSETKLPYDQHSVLTYFKSNDLVQLEELLYQLRLVFLPSSTTLAELNTLVDQELAVRADRQEVVVDRLTGFHQLKKR